MDLQRRIQQWEPVDDSYPPERPDTYGLRIFAIDSEGREHEMDAVLEDFQNAYGTLRSVQRSMTITSVRVANEGGTIYTAGIGNPAVLTPGCSLKIDVHVSGLTTTWRD